MISFEGTPVLEGIGESLSLKREASREGTRTARKSYGGDDKILLDSHDSVQLQFVLSRDRLDGENHDPRLHRRGKVP